MNNLVAYVRSRSGTGIVMFRDTAFITASEKLATKFESVVELQAAITAAYKGGSVSLFEINHYMWKTIKI